MARIISALQPNGEVMVLEVMPETTGRALKQQIKNQTSWDELTRNTTGVEIIVGDDQLLGNDVTVLEAGIAEDSVVSVVFKPNKVICCYLNALAGLGGIADPDLLLVVEIPDEETEIRAVAFFGQSTLAKLTIPDSVTHIGNRAFVGCSSLVSLTIPNSVTHIGDGAFADCSSLQCLTIPDSVTHIERFAFASCSSLASLTIPNSVTHIGSSAFQGCSALVSLTIPNSVTHIGGEAFSGCSSLASLTIPNSVTHIGDFAFADCSSLQSLTIPDSVTHIGDNAFVGCKSLVLRVSVLGMSKLRGCKRIVAAEGCCHECFDFRWFLLWVKRNALS